MRSRKKKMTWMAKNQINILDDTLKYTCIFQGNKYSHQSKASLTFVLNHNAYEYIKQFHSITSDPIPGIYEHREPDGVASSKRKQNKCKRKISAASLSALENKNT